MRAIIVSGLLLLFVSLWPAHAQGQSTPCVENGRVKNDGQCWLTLNYSEKTGFIRGLWLGADTRGLADDLIDDQASYSFNRDWLTTPSSTTAADIIGYLDRLYESPANRNIHLSWAYVLAVMNASDDDSDDRLSLLRFLRENANVPTYGTLIDVKAPNLITIEHAKKRYDIHLAGVTDQGMTPAQRERAMAFLRGFRKSDFADCDSPKDTQVILIYGTELFRGENRLSAMVKFNRNVVCAGKQTVFMEDLDVSTPMFLNYYLISHGLAYHDESKDPKWSDRTARNRDMSYSLKLAKDKGFYLHGRTTHPTIEKLIEANLRPQRNEQPTSRSSQTPRTDTESNSEKTGSGFLVSADTIVTNFHVVDQCRPLRITNLSGTERQGKLIVADEQNDLAVIKIDQPFVGATRVALRAASPIRVGESITVIGFPLPGVLSASSTVTTGVISNSAGLKNDMRMMQISAPVQPGNSGGPVFDQKGFLVGITVGKLDALSMAKATGDIPQNVNFAIKDHMLRAMLDANQIGYSTELDSGFKSDVVGAGRAATVFLRCGG